LNRFITVSLIVFFSMLAGGMIVATNVKKFQAGRDPAAIRQVYDFTHLHGSILDTAVKERLVSGLETFKDDQGFGIGLGHFAFSLDSGEKVLGCRAYQKVTFQFEAEGIAVEGEKPTMTVEGKCEYSNDLTKINPLWIPVARIFGEHPGDGDFNDYERPVQLKFAHVSDVWPKHWVLIGLSIQGDQGKVEVDRSEMSQILGRPFMIDLQDN
jgi:hypothetical protein